MSGKLLPCPFCGGEARLFHIPENTVAETKKHPKWLWNNPGMWTVGCDTSMCLGSINNVAMCFYTERLAVNTWNRRANDG